MWRVLMAIGLVLGVVVFSTENTVACSCAAMSPREQLEQADAAFVGTLIAREPETVSSDGSIFGGEEVAWTFEVEQAVKGEFGDTVDVQSPIDTAACGFGVIEGQRIGVFLYEHQGQWHGGSCGTVDPDTLLRAVQPPPAPDGSGPVRLLVADQSDEARIVALDGEGRTLAYGAGDGEVRSIAVCPGSERFVELVAIRGGEEHRLVVLDLRRFEVVSDVELPGMSPDVMAMSCRDRAGDDVLIHEARHWQSSTDGRILQVQGTEFSELYIGPMDPDGGNNAIFDVENNVAYMTRGSHGHEISVIDLASGDELRVITLPIAEDEHGYIISLALNPDGTRLAALGYQPSGGQAHFRVLVLDVAIDPFEIREHALGTTTQFSTVFWLDDETFIVSGDDPYPDGAPVYDAALNQVASLPGWSVHAPVKVGETLYGLSGYGMLVAAPLPDGPGTTLRTFDNPNLRVLAGVPGDVEIEPQMAPTPAPTLAVTSAPQATAEPIEPVDDDATASESGNLGMWLGAGLLAVIVAGGGWGVYRWRGR